MTQNHREESSNKLSPPTSNSIWRWVWVVLVVAAIGWWGMQWKGNSPGKEDGGKEKGHWGNKGQAVPVTTATVKPGPMRNRLDALGTVVPARMVTVRARVDGQLLNIPFQEGAMVQAGDLLAEIDPRPFQIQLAQAKGQLSRDTALLENARNDAARYQTLLAKNNASRQQADTQKSLVHQYQGAVDVDRALVDTATLNLSYTRITAPISGIVGLRQVDAGNMIRQSEAGGLVTIAQIQPVHVTFSLPEDNLPNLLPLWRKGDKLAVELFDRERKNRLADGFLLTIDNQIDTTTGTIKVKAAFANQDHALYPNQFVNTTLILSSRKDALLIPSAAVQRGRQGLFVYLVQEDKTIALRPIKPGAAEGDMTSIEEGLAVGEKVVVEGTDKLRQGSKIEEIIRENNGNKQDHKKKDSGKGRDGS